MVDLVKNDGNRTGLVMVLNVRSRAAPLAAAASAPAALGGFTREREASDSGGSGLVGAASAGLPGKRKNMSSRMSSGFAAPRFAEVGKNILAIG